MWSLVKKKKTCLQINFQKWNKDWRHNEFQENSENFIMAKPDKAVIKT